MKIRLEYILYVGTHFGKHIHDIILKMEFQGFDFFLSLPEDIFSLPFFFKRERKRERERHQCKGEELIGSFPHVPRVENRQVWTRDKHLHGEWNLQPRDVPDWELNLNATF